MLDVNKRKTLKLLSAAPLVGMPVFAGASENVAKAVSLEMPLQGSTSGMCLDIQVINTSAVPDNNLLIKNTSVDTLVIKRFMPGHVIYGDNVIDLNELLTKTQLTLAPGQSKSFDFKVNALANVGPMEYVWADHSEVKLSGDTSIIRLGAFMADTNAVIYANTNPVYPS